MDSTIRSILLANKINEEFLELHTSGVANRIFVTQHYVVRVPTDHEEALNDAKTESIAAPLARSYGIITPKLINYDDSCFLLDRSYSIWERVHGFSVDQLRAPFRSREIWITLGKELGLLHSKVKECSDPKGWLDSPERDYTQRDMLDAVLRIRRNSSKLISKINQLYESANDQIGKVFVHGDTHTGNIMCTYNYTYSGLIDWGDSGWADPTIDFYMIPHQALELVLSGYKSNNIIIDDCFISRIILDKIWALCKTSIDIETIQMTIEVLESQLK